MIFCLESTTDCMSEWSFFSSSSTDINLTTQKKTTIKEGNNKPRGSGPPTQTAGALVSCRGSAPQPPADDALHLQVLVVLRAAQAFLRVLQPGLVLLQHALVLLVLHRQAGLVLLQALGRSPETLLENQDLLLVLRDTQGGQVSCS